jgi:hypothetical protein
MEDAMCYDRKWLASEDLNKAAKEADKRRELASKRSDVIDALLRYAARARGKIETTRAKDAAPVK